MSDAPIRVLLVDDHPALRKGLAAFLEESADLNVVAQAGNGAEAIATYAERGPDIDVCVVDLRLPDMAGADVIKQIRAQDGEARCLVLTTYDRPEDMHRSFAAGAAAYLVKDADHEDIVQVIRSVARGKSFVPNQYRNAPPGPPRWSLSPREKEVLQLAATGKGNRDIAAALGLSHETIKTHMERIREKLEAPDRTSAVATAIKLGLLD